MAEQGTQSEPMELLQSPWPMRRPAPPRPAEGSDEAQLRNAWRSLEALRRRTEKAEAAKVTAEGKLQEKDALIEELTQQLEAARQAP